MINFRCWYCNKPYSLADKRIGERMTCSCQNVLRVPKRDNGNSKFNTLTDWIVVTVVYGGGGAVIGLVAALIIVGQWWIAFSIHYVPALVLTGSLMLAGLLAGLLGGERGITWLRCAGRWLVNDD
jgi:hypothetical protein